MVERKEVEALLAACEMIRERDLDPVNHAPIVLAPELAALCRAWLAMDSGQIETVREAKFFDGHRVGKLIATAPEHMIGQRVRIVREPNESSD